jgi:hypothetical protein
MARFHAKRKRTAAVRKYIIVSLSLALVLGFSHASALAQARKPPEPEPDSEYVEKRDSPKRDDSGGLLDFLPFVRRKPAKVEPETLTPSPLPQESKPVLQREELAQLRSVAENWVLTSEYAEPAIRQDDNGQFYRDYIVFADEYEAKVLRGRSQEKPFIGHVYIKGDYFKTQSHNDPESASADFKFKFLTREFRVVFDRVKKWEYSSDPDSEPYIFVERWEFNGLQSRSVVSLSEDLTPPAPHASPTLEDGKKPASQPDDG